MSWIENTHPEYDELYKIWEYIQDHYEASRIYDNLDTYLIQKTLGEPTEAYEERQSLAAYKPYFAYAVESISGQSMATEPTRDFGELLGDPEDADSIAFQMWHNANEGMNWDVLWSQFTTDIIAYRDVWVLVDPKTEARPQPTVKIINPLDVTDWIETDGKLQAVKVRDTDFSRDALEIAEEADEQYLVFNLDGWVRYTKVLKNEEDVVKNKATPEYTEIEVARGAYYFEDRNGSACLPIFRVRLPIRRMAGYLLAKLNNDIFNKESDKDWLERSTTAPFFVHYASDDEFNKTATQISNGSRFIQGQMDARHKSGFESPDASPAEAMRESVEQKKKEFLFLAYKEYSDSSKQITATEKQLNIVEGVGAFLSSVVSSVDEAENRVLWLLEQCYFPYKVLSLNEEGEVVTEQEITKNKDKWGTAKVKRSKDFVPQNESEFMKRLKEDVFGFEPIPLPETTKQDAAKTLAEYYRLKYEEDEIDEAVSASEATRTQGNDADAELERLTREVDV